MPTYDYLCSRCGNEFQEFQKISSKPGAKCPKCGGKAERQLSGGAGLVFKGSGFYLTDYGRSGQKKPSGEGSSDGGGESRSDKSETKKADTAKPAESKPKKKKDD